jgi:hypothetical protein
VVPFRHIRAATLADEGLVATYTPIGDVPLAFSVSYGVMLAEFCVEFLLISQSFVKL